jgi:MoxR-like ATPase
MNHLAYFALEMTDLREREAEREIALRRKRVGDDDAPSRIRDRKWAAAIHRWALERPTADSAPDTSSTVDISSRTDATAPASRSAAAGAATLGCASA